MTTAVNLMTDAELSRHTTDETGFGALGTDKGNLPLESLDVRATLTGLASRTELTQGFRNPYDEPLEATYIFPLPSRAAVIALRMEADGRTVEGELKERAEARASYDQAIDAGQRASIAEEERPGVFTMRVGNILPGERVTIRLTLVGQLPYEDGEATFRFPLVVAPRYIPGTSVGGKPVGDGTAPDTDAVPDGSRITPPVLLPGFPNPVTLSAQVELDPAGLTLGAVRSSLHVTTDEQVGERLVVRLNPGERADRDFLLRFALGSPSSEATALAVVPDSDDSGEGTFALTVLPPSEAPAGRPRDVVLVLDRSGSMGGWKMVAARRAAARIIDTLTSTDRFAVLTFDSVVESPPELGTELAEATDRNRFRAVEHLAGVTARGGTEMAGPLRRAAELLADGPDRDRVLVLVTDGQVGNEDQLLRTLAPSLDGLRVHTVGVDRAVNEAFLRRLALLGGGRCELVESEDRLDEAMANIHRRIASPLVLDLALDAGDLTIDADSVTPARLPSLFAGAPVVVTGRYRGTPAGTVTVRGRRPDGTEWTAAVPAVTSDNASLTAVWARSRVRDLEDRYASQGAQPDLEREIVATSLRFGVLSRFTAFVAVDARVVNEGGVTKRVTQPVDLPQGWVTPEPVAYGGPGLLAGAPVAASFTTMAAPAGPPQVPGGPSFAPASAPALSRMRKAHRPVDAGLTELALPAALVRFATEQLAILRATPAGDRPSALTELASQITALIALGDLPDDVLKPLRNLAAELASESSDLEHRWLRAHDVLEALGAADATPPKQPFWKR